MFRQIAENIYEELIGDSKNVKFDSADLKFYKELAFWSPRCGKELIKEIKEM